jgi:hypothetical protein
MENFGLSFKKGKEIIRKKECANLQEAYIYFSKIKQMALSDFKKIFIVIKL